ncbi:hypothetical protein NOR_00354 [Metarhizium rileyi]|uniref:Uncharacterized protein n=1 Tax=Metarhizium rileyi (strain RCEF 4871) TaxID=1649241 RepID=A0A167KHX9_METRR|nr:hypothetical protein NOR_00354 [Metarhizium rileyi RCEF 4871]TWU73097.1 hypothetical protein ED733_004386 [Metarhizium rileyi]
MCPTLIDGAAVDVSGYPCSVAAVDERETASFSPTVRIRSVRGREWPRSQLTAIRGDGLIAAWCSAAPVIGSHSNE